MARLARDARGSTLAIMAIALIPISAMAGSGVDIARMYVVKNRLQQACDAGVLAGRKFMADSSASTLDDNAKAQAKQFFANNFTSGYLSSAAFTKDTSPYPFTPTKTSDNQVAGTASIVLPMSVMKMFGMGDQTISVTCQARFDIADTDVMFVLDTTGSMACGPSDPDSCGQSTVSYTRPDNTTGYKVTEKSNSRISALRSAVLSFYDTVAANADPSTHVRYGFVPYTSTVNAGYAITSVSPDYMVSQWSYDSRHIIGDQTEGGSKPYSGGYPGVPANSNGTYTGVDQRTCASYNGLRNPTTGYGTDGSAKVYSTSWTSASGGTCTATEQLVGPRWRYELWPYDVSGYVAGNTVDDPSKVTTATTKWQGCIEERDTVVASSFDANNLPPDLDPDLIPSKTDDRTRWRPMWPDVVYARTNATTVDSPASQSNPYSNPYGDNSSYGALSGSNPSLSSVNASYNTLYYTTSAGQTVQYLPSGYMVCGKPVQRLTANMSRSDVANYVNAADFVAWGGTYHDTGMIWGVRMISPNGVFANDTATWPGRNPPNRYIVFMTDGHMSTNQNIYGMYGWENFDKRTTGGAYSSSDDYHNARFLAECQAAKNRNIKVYVVSLASTLDDNLKACASPNAAYYASDSASLTTAFKTIASQVAMLRISQ